LATVTASQCLAQSGCSELIIIPLLVNMIVICVLVFGLVATALGIASPDQLLVSSALSGLLTMLSFKLSKETNLHIDSELEMAEPERKESPTEV
jgi:hypothetical protein